MTDIRITGGPAPYIPEITILANDIETDDGLDSAVNISLFCDAQADPSDVLPDGETDRRGYWADEFEETPAKTGSKLWLLDRAGDSPSTRKQAEQYAKEALQWMIDQGVAKSVSAQVSSAGEVRFIDVTITRPEGAAVKFRYGLNWKAKAAANGI